MNDTAIKNYCIWARAELLNEVENRMQRYGILEEGAEPADAQTVGGVALSTQEQKQRAQLLEMQVRMGHAALRDKAAYTWFNRIIAIRFMELHDYLPSGIRVFCSANDANAFEPEIVKEALDIDLPCARQEEIVPLVQAGEDEPLFRYLLLAQCNELAECLPAVFEPVGSALELLLPSGLLRKESVVGQLVVQLPWGGEADSGIGWSDVEILGWMYQFYNSEVKDEFFKSKRKATARDIAPATQLFTPEWIVRYMVENSLGRLWMMNNPESTLRESMEYYIEPDAEHEDFIHINGPEEITLCDPACGSGHILVYAFELLFQMYVSRGYRERDIPQLILENNLTGMEIDPRAAQIASLALVMCARQHDRRFFKRDVQADINVIAPTRFDEGELPEGAALLGQPQLVDALAHLDEVGSLLSPTEAELSALVTDVKRFAGREGQASFFGNKLSEKLLAAQETSETLARKFTCVVANPPYMASSSFSPFMSKWIKKHYPDVKSDLCTCFIERCFASVKEHGYSTLVTMQSWMFLGSFEKMRTKLIEQHSIVSMAHIGARGFDSIGGEVVSTTATVFSVGQPGVQGEYLRLVDPVGEAAKAAAAKEAIANPNCGYFYRRNAKTFTQISGTPIAYWASVGLLDVYRDGARLADFVDARVGMISGDNGRFLRLWFEVGKSKFGLQGSFTSPSRKKWIPIQKGGEYRLWYGNLSYVVNWENEGWEIKNDNYDGSRVRSHNYNGDMAFRSGITWNSITSSRFQCRYAPEGFLFDAAGPLCFVKPEEASLEMVLGFMSSSVFIEIMGIVNPTLNFPPNYIESAPVPLGIGKGDLIDPLVRDCVEISRNDWDLFETSWNFKRHPLV